MKASFIRRTGIPLAYMTALGISLLAASAATAAPYSVAVFGGLDKITAKVSAFEATKDKPTRFGALELIVRACDMHPPEDTPQTAAYVEIRQINEENETVDPAPIFKGWIFAESPGLNGLEHPVYDIWLKTCKIPVAP